MHFRPKLHVLMTPPSDNRTATCVSSAGPTPFSTCLPVLRVLSHLNWDVWRYPPHRPSVSLAWTVVLALKAQHFLNVVCVPCPVHLPQLPSISTTLDIHLRFSAVCLFFSFNHRFWYDSGASLLETYPYITTHFGHCVEDVRIFLLVSGRPQTVDCRLNVSSENAYMSERSPRTTTLPNNALMMSPRRVMKRLQSICRAQGTNQRPSTPPKLPTFSSRELGIPRKLESTEKRPLNDTLLGVFDHY
ncbi:hypothetical protein CSKR_109379 [Clonorchis sinensis]|uniref:Uncharacterized protein n=1 Tax=Clonorchis sinensis TaxID=79923 RepID=A0A3R7JLV5_CLOSI|nr:hypothetical protein CSKR_109379 [Clonorchis sinensis]